MKEESLKKIKLLKSPLSTNVDHLLILRELYFEYSKGEKRLQPLMNYYLDGIDDLPELSEKSNWNEKEFVEKRKPFINTFKKLAYLIETHYNI